MLRTVWAKVEGRRRLYLIDERRDFIEPVKLYLDHLAALEKSPHTLENYCRHLGRYFRFLQREAVDWRNVRPDHLVHFIQQLRNEQGNDKRLTERSVSSFYRYHVQRGSQLESPVFYEQISDRFSNFRRLLVHLSHGRTVKRTLKLTEPRHQIKIVAETTSTASFLQRRTSSSNASCC